MSDVNSNQPAEQPQPVSPAPAAPVSPVPTQQLDPNTVVPIMLNVNQVQQVLNIIAKQPLETVIDVFASIKNQAEAALRQMTNAPTPNVPVVANGNGAVPETLINGKERPSRRGRKPH